MTSDDEEWEEIEALPLLCIAAEKGCYTAVKMLLEGGAKAVLENNTVMVTLYQCCMSGWIR